MVKSVCWSVGPSHWSRLKNLNTCWMDCCEILNRHLWLPTGWMQLILLIPWLFLWCHHVVDISVFYWNFSALGKKTVHFSFKECCALRKVTARRRRCSAALHRVRLPSASGGSRDTSVRGQHGGHACGASKQIAPIVQLTPPPENTDTPRRAGRAGGAWTHSSMDEENKLQFPSLPVTTEELLVRQQPLADMSTQLTSTPDS